MTLILHSSTHSYSLVTRNLASRNVEKFAAKIIKLIKINYFLHNGSAQSLLRVSGLFSVNDFQNFNFDKRLFAERHFKKVTHCLFDLDGTILDSENMYHEVVKKICQKYGKRYTKDMKNRLWGATDRAMAITVVGELKLPLTIEEFETQVSDLAKQILPGAPLQKGVERLLKHLHEHNIPLALATNSNEQAVRLHAAAKPQLFGLFHHMVSASDPEVDRGKPQPDIYLVAAERFPEKPKPIQCLVFEDSVRGVAAAVAAGMQVVMIPDPRTEREQTRNATLTIRSLLDFRPERFGLPPFRNN